MKIEPFPSNHQGVDLIRVHLSNGYRVDFSFYPIYAWALEFKLSFALGRIRVILPSMIVTYYNLD